MDMRVLLVTKLLLFFIPLITMEDTVSLCQVSELSRSLGDDICYYGQCEQVNINSLTEVVSKSSANGTIHVCIKENETLSNMLVFENMIKVNIREKKGSSANISCSNSKSGIIFVNIMEVVLAGVTLWNCGCTSKDLNHSSALFVFVETADLRNVSILRSQGTGMEFMNVLNISLRDISVSFSRRRGINITTKMINTSQILINGSRFVGNNIVLDSEDASIHTTNAKYWGGGLYTRFEEVQRVDIVIENSTFDKNVASHGGGLATDDINSSVSIKLRYCFFTCNRARYGGGTYISFNLLAPWKFSQEIQLESTAWKSNLGLYGSAATIEPHYFSNNADELYSFVQPILHDCHFSNNSDLQSFVTHDYKYPNYKLYERPKGALYCKGVQLKLSGTMYFVHNKASAIYAVSCDVSFSFGAQLTFSRNHGYRGGAIALYATSKLILENNISAKFEHNSVTYKGGAIFQRASNFEDDMKSKFCFLQAKTPDTMSRTLHFQNNKASKGGNSLFLTTLKRCRMTKNNAVNYSDILNKYASFTFQETLNEVETMGSDFRTRDTSTIKEIIPGKPTDLEFSVIDNTGNVIDTVYRALIFSTNNNLRIEIDDAYTYIANNKIILLGQPYSTGILKLYLLHFENDLLYINVSLTDCPPGFLVIAKKCTCSTTLYEGIDKCDMDLFQSFLRHGYWAGYCNFNSRGTGEFCTSNCPVHFCDRDFTGNSTSTLLPSTANVEELSKVVCSQNRKGILCGSCIENHSVFFHDATFSCQQNKLCNLGMLFYIASEIIPATIFFAVVISLDITFTSGGISGFIFYVQIFDTLFMNGNNLIRFEFFPSTLLQSLYFIVRTFNLSFFSLKSLSFCIKDNADALDMIAFNYITLLYCFFLMFATILLKNKCSIKLNLYLGLKKTQLSDSMIHGLSSFLVLCYYECTKVNFLLLTSVSIGKQSNSNRRVFFNGDVRFMSSRHVIYVLPALFFLVTVTIIPPVLLFCYPLCYKVLALFHLQESKLTRILCKCIPLEKYKPVFDSFQSTFKDEHRYFAGLHFMFRSFVLLLYFISGSPTHKYVMLNMMFLLMLTLHTSLRPYKRDQHNTLDTLIFSLLIILNTITLFNYQEVRKSRGEAHIIHYTAYIQVLLAWIPLVCMFFYLCTKFFTKVKKLFISKRKHLRRNIISMMLSGSLLGMEEQRRDMVDMSYDKW